MSNINVASYVHGIGPQRRDVEASAIETHAGAGLSSSKGIKTAIKFK